MNEHYPFVLPPLPYAYDALVPHLDAATLGFHHDQHFAGYVTQLNAILQTQSAYQDWSLERLVTDWAELPDKIRIPVRNQAGGVYNHTLYFDSLAPLPVKAPSPLLLGAICRSFGSPADFRAALKTAALAQFGSGHIWLTATQEGNLSLTRCANQDTPLPALPLLCTDVWEHAYYLQYQNRRAEYFDNWFLLVDWEKISAHYAQFLSNRPPYPQP